MKLSTILAVSFALSASGARIILSNDDGWADQLLRVFNDRLVDQGHDVVISAPTEDRSKAGLKLERPKKRKKPCHHNSCPGSGDKWGQNRTQPDLFWVNSPPAKAMEMGIKKFGPIRWEGLKPELAVTGPNNGKAVGSKLFESGAIGAAVVASRMGIPGIAFSAGKEKESIAWNAPETVENRVYAELAAEVVDAIIAHGKPYLPKNVFLSVNFQTYNNETCNHPSAYHWGVARLGPSLFRDLVGPPDVKWCQRWLDWDAELMDYKSPDCWVSIGIGENRARTTANNRRKQRAVIEKFKRKLSCRVGFDERAKPASMLYDVPYDFAEYEDYPEGVDCYECD